MLSKLAMILVEEGVLKIAVLTFSLFKFDIPLKILKNLNVQIKKIKS